MTYDLIVVGDGLAARVFLYQLSELLRESCAQIPSVLVISDNQSYTPCSLRTTATISKVGMQMGVGEHGDRLLRAYGEFENFARALAPGIVTQTRHYQVLMEDDPANEGRFHKRYGPTIVTSMGLKAAVGESYLVDPLALMNFLSSQSIFNDQLLHIKESVLALDHEGAVVTLRGRYQGKYIFVAAGAPGEELLADTRELGDSPAVGESVLGSYLEWSCDNPLADLGESWQVALAKFNVLYRHLDRRLLVGGTTTKNIHCFHPLEMKSQYDMAQEVLGAKLPPFSEASHLVGERSKLAGRRPYWGHITGRTWAVRGLYKNGFTLAFLAARELLEDRKGLGALV